MNSHSVMTMIKPTICSDTHDDPEVVHQLEAQLLDGMTASGLANLFKALADPTRVRIIGVLAHAEVCVGDLTLALGMSQPAVSHHLKLLRHWKIVSTRRDGKHIYYTLQDEHVDALFQQALEHIRHE